ncbi:MAG: hypothetical protein FJX03_03750 [Alphaproteobacteria bacterium]|nr:hypothetical protein [Alphaproteobacteria bacterium]
MNKNIHLLISILLTLFSLKTYATTSPDDNYVVICGSKASSAYKKFVQSPAKAANWQKQLLKFAEEGERDAILTIKERLNNAQKEEAFVRDLAKKQNKAAVPILAKHLQDQRNPECVIWYKRSEKAELFDVDFRINFAMALLFFEKEVKESLEVSFKLLQKWEYEDKTDTLEDHQFLLGAYVLLFEGIKKLGHVNLIYNYVDWRHKTSENTKLIRSVFINIFQGTPYINLIAKEKGVLPVLVSLEDILKEGHIEELVAKILQENKHYANNVISIVIGNLFAILQDKEIREFPNRKYRDFNPNKATLSQIIYWAREIIYTKRSQLIYSGDDIMLKQLFSEIDNVTLEKYLVSAFKEMFCLEF